MYIVFKRVGNMIDSNVCVTGSRKRDVDDILNKHPHKIPVSLNLLVYRSVKYRSF